MPQKLSKTICFRLRLGLLLLLLLLAAG